MVSRDKLLKDALVLLLEYLHEWCADLRALDHSDISIKNLSLEWYQKRLTWQIIALDIKEDNETSNIKKRERIKLWREEQKQLQQ